jgi:hypothetical protein
MDMHAVTDRDIERIIRLKRNWWRLYLAELVRLMFGKSASAKVRPPHDGHPVVLRMERSS